MGFLKVKTQPRVSTLTFEAWTGWRENERIKSWSESSSESERRGWGGHRVWSGMLRVCFHRLLSARAGII